MDSFAFMIHPIDPKKDVSRKFPLLGRLLSERQISFFSTYFPPVYISEIRGIRSAATGKQIKGWFLACPLTPDRMLSLPVKRVYRKIIQTGQMAERLGADILGLGAFTSVVGDGGITIASALDIPVTTGDAYTVSVAMQAIRNAARIMEIPLEMATAAVVGATGAIGRICCEMLAKDVSQLYLIGRRADRLEQLRRKLQLENPAVRFSASTSTEVLLDADVILAASSSKNAIVQPENLRSGSLICDVARPRDISPKVAALREDVLVIDGGTVEIPGAVDFGFDFGLPEGQAYACMAETMALALEGRLEDYTLGKSISLARVDEITAIAERHGFRLSGLRSFDKPVTEETIARICQRARARERVSAMNKPRRLLWEKPDY
jgi:fatty aldehyde-generating acyl-ACP reductase